MVTSTASSLPLFSTVKLPSIIVPGATGVLSISVITSIGPKFGSQTSTDRPNKNKP